MDKLKPGMTVKVFQNPIMGEDYEGKATLIKIRKGLLDSEDNLSIWLVNFLEDQPEDYYQRTINLDNCFD